jgi:hypothetical protein
MNLEFTGHEVHDIMVAYVCKAYNVLPESVEVVTLLHQEAGAHLANLPLIAVTIKPPTVDEQLQSFDARLAALAPKGT